jgi:hypothetical protein
VLARGALAMCAMWMGFPSSFFAGGRKKQNKFSYAELRLAPPNYVSIKFALSSQKAKSFLFSIYHYRNCLLVCLFTLVANGGSYTQGREFPDKLSTISCLSKY